MRKWALLVLLVLVVRASFGAQTPNSVMASAAPYQALSSVQLAMGQLALLSILSGGVVIPANTLMTSAAAYESLSDHELQVAQTYLLTQLAPIGATNTAVVRGVSYGTITAAKKAAVAGDTIFINPGTFTENNLLKAGVNYYFSPGATVFYQQATTNDAGFGIFDDRTTSGGTTNVISGAGTFVFLTCTNVISSSGTLGTYVTATLGAVVVTNPSSVLILSGHEVGIGNILTAPAIGAGVAVTGCKYVSITLDDIYDPWNGLSIIVTDTVDGTDPFNSVTSGIYWLDGTNIHCHVGTIGNMGQYGIWGAEPAGGNRTNNFWFEGQDVLTKLYVDSHSANFRSWYNINYLFGSGGAAGFYSGGKHYLTVQKMETTSTTTPCLETTTNTTVWLTCEKMTSAGSWIGTPSGSAAGGTVYAAVQQYEENGTVDPGFVFRLGSTNVIIGGKAKCSGMGVNNFGGSVLLDGLTIDNSGGTKPPIFLSGSGLKLKNTTLIGPNTTNSISASSAQTIGIWTPSSSNRNTNSNATLSPNAGFTVDAAIQ